MYSTISAWNADESLLILYAGGGTATSSTTARPTQLIRALDINPADVEQVYWDTSDPDLLYYIDGQDFIRYHVGTTEDDACTTSAACAAVVADQRRRSDVHLLGLASPRPGLRQQDVHLRHRRPTRCSGPTAVSGTPPAQVAPSGTLAYLEAGSGQILDATLNMVRSLTLQAPDNHASLGRLANGHDTWNGAVYDDGNDDASSNVGILVTWDLTSGTGGAIIGPKTGYPYPPDGHVSAMAYRQPGWIFVSTIWTGFDGTGTAPTPGLLDLENLIADTNTGDGLPRRTAPQLGQGQHRPRLLGRGAHRPEPERHARRVRQRLGQRHQRRQLRPRAAELQALTVRDSPRAATAYLEESSGLRAIALSRPSPLSPGTTPIPVNRVMRRSESFSNSSVRRRSMFAKEQEDPVRAAAVGERDPLHPLSRNPRFPNFSEGSLIFAHQVLPRLLLASHHWPIPIR